MQTQRKKPNSKAQQLKDNAPNEQEGIESVDRPCRSLHDELLTQGDQKQISNGAEAQEVPSNQTSIKNFALIYEALIGLLRTHGVKVSPQPNLAAHKNLADMTKLFIVSSRCNVLLAHLSRLEDEEYLSNTELLQNKNNQKYKESIMENIKTVVKHVKTVLNANEGKFVLQAFVKQLNRSEHKDDNLHKAELFQQELERTLSEQKAINLESPTREQFAQWKKDFKTKERKQRKIDAQTQPRQPRPPDLLSKCEDGLQPFPLLSQSLQNCLSEIGESDFGQRHQDRIQLKKSSEHEDDNLHNAEFFQQLERTFSEQKARNLEYLTQPRQPLPPDLLSKCEDGLQPFTRLIQSQENCLIQIGEMSDFGQRHQDCIQLNKTCANLLKQNANLLTQAKEQHQEEDKLIRILKEFLNKINNFHSGSKKEEKLLESLQDLDPDGKQLEILTQWGELQSSLVSQVGIYTEFNQQLKESILGGRTNDRKNRIRFLNETPSSMNQVQREEVHPEDLQKRKRKREEFSVSEPPRKRQCRR